jgi:hypothetical protein
MLPPSCRYVGGGGLFALVQPAYKRSLGQVLGWYWEFNGDWVSGFVSYIDGMDGVGFNEDPKQGLQSECTE